MYRWTVAKLLRFVYRRAIAGQDGLMMAATAADVRFSFPGSSSFAASLVGREALREWLARFRALSPRFDIRDVTVSGPPWNMTVALRFRDAIGADYENEGVEWLRIRWGRVRSLGARQARYAGRQARLGGAASGAAGAACRAADATGAVNGAAGAVRVCALLDTAGGPRRLRRVRQVYMSGLSDNRTRKGDTTR
jgi:SnoaL-like domain